MATPVANSVSLPVIDAANGTLTDEFINVLVEDGSWQFGGGPHVLTYSFSLANLGGSSYAWTAPLQSAVTQAMSAWASVADISFIESGSGGFITQSGANIALALTGSDLVNNFGAAALGVFPDPVFGAQIESEFPGWSNNEGDILFDHFYSGNVWLNAGGFGLETLIHELGHALGLKHPDDAGDGNDPSFGSLQTLPAYFSAGLNQYQDERWTLMFTDPASISFSSGNAATPMPLDILAMQQIYGANMSYHAGNDTYVVAPDGNNALRTIWDAGGSDTIDASGYSQAVTINLAPGFGYVQSASGFDGLTALAFNMTIEGALGGASHDTITGNAANNYLGGNAGFDTLDGAGGTDTLAGGLDGDYYLIDSADDLALEATDAGDDIVVSTVSYALGANLEQLMLSGSGDLSGTGNASNNFIVGNAGNNLLDGGTGLDILRGGLGDDTYVVDGTDDIIQEFEWDSGTDLVLSSVSYTISGNLENLTLTGGLNIDGTGSDSDNRLTGNDGNNNLFAAGGADTVIGGLGDDTLEGGTGTDNLEGGAGHDVYILFDNDTISEQANAGSDTVMTSFAYVLAANFENLTLIGSGDISGTGNTVANLMVGNGGANLLEGRADNDTLMGGAGVDTLIGGAQHDSMIGGDGSDRLEGNLGADTLNGGPGLDFLLGGQANDFLQGQLGFDTLDGGLGVDSVLGGQGNDLVLGNNGNDWLEGNLGSDVLAGGQHDDTLLGGNGEDSLAGDAGNDSLVGAGGNDLLNGGAGNDVLDGGAGNDLADYSAAVGDLDINLSAGTGLAAELGIDTLAGIESVRGGAGNDTLVSNASGNHRLEGGAGEDSLIAASGSDTLLGGGDDDFLDGGAGNDVLDGGDGNDVFLYEDSVLGAVDTPADGRDTIYGDSGDAISMLGLNDELMIGGTALSALISDTAVGSTLVAATTNIAFSGGVLQIDVDGNGAFNAASDFQITLGGVTSVTFQTADGLFHLV